MKDVLRRAFIIPVLVGALELQATPLGAQSVQKSAIVVLRLESEAPRAGGFRLASPKGDSIDFDSGALVTNGDFARFLYHHDATGHSLVGVLKADVKERVRARSVAAVGKRVGVIVDGKLEAVWTLQRPLSGSAVPLIVRQSREDIRRLGAALGVQVQ